MNLFEMYADVTKEFEAEQQKLREKKLEEEKKNEPKEKTSSEKSTSKVKTSKANENKPKFDPNKKIEDDLKKYPKIIVKAYGLELIVIEGETEIEAIKLNEIKDRIINEFQYQELSAGISWHLVPNADKSVGYLVATGKFHAKG